MQKKLIADLDMAIKELVGVKPKSKQLLMGYYMDDLNKAIIAFDNYNGYVTTYSQRELEAMFDYSLNSGLSTIIVL